MKNLWGYISRTGSHPQTLDNPYQQDENANSKPIIIDYYPLKQLQAKFREEENINILYHPQTKVNETFSDVMESLHGLLNVIEQLRAEAEKNAEKLNEYDRLKGLATHHTQIVNELQEQASKNLNRIYEEKRALSTQYEGKLQDLQNKIREKQQQLNSALLNIEEKEEENKSLRELLEQRNKQINQLSKDLKLAKKRIEQFTKLEDNSIKIETKGYNLGDKVEIENILVYSKLRKCIYSFISPQDFKNLSQTSRQIHYICSRTLKKQYISTLIKNKNEELFQMSKSMKEFQKIFDTFPAENIRTNAIKYLFFKIKPGAYILPYFQEEQEPIQKVVEQKSKLSQISSFFKKKNEADQTKQKVLTFQVLKNDHDFKEVQKKVEIFFDKLFGIEGQADLKFFNETMKKQLNQLKSQLKNTDKNMQLLCISKFLYLEMNQLNNLLQVCFALLINKHNDIKQLNKKNNDLKQNDKVLRNLVDSIANDRQTIEKRIFFLENQNLKHKSVKQILQQEIKMLRKSETTYKQQNQQSKLEIRNLQQALEESQQHMRSLQEKWGQVLKIVKQIPVHQMTQE